MEEIIYEIIVGAIILGVILLVIALFRNGVGTIRETVNSQAEIEDVRDYDLIGVDGGIYGGEKIAEAFSYSKVAPISFDVIVENRGGGKDRINSLNYSSYPSSKRYKLEVVYLSKVYCPANRSDGSWTVDSNDVRERNAKDILEIRFLFKEQ